MCTFECFGKLNHFPCRFKNRRIALFLSEVYVEFPIGENTTDNPTH